MAEGHGERVSVAVYRREVAASIARVWENVHDWEHLPWLHASSFGDIELEESGPWGWRARIQPSRGGEGASFRLELVVADEGDRYVSRTLEGPGAGTEIWTRLEADGADRTRVEVDFRVPGVPEAKRDAVGAGYVALYTRLWDEDEAMMVHRERAVSARRASRSGSPAPVDLGDRDELESSLPRIVDFHGHPVRVVKWRGEWIAHSARCPHWLGPLEIGPDDAGVVRCPWHGYAFDLATRRSCDGRGLRLAAAPDVVVDERSGRVSLRARPD